MTTHALPNLDRPRRREKMFGAGRCIPLDRNAKARITMYARTLMRPTEPGKHYGRVTAKAFAVLQALLWGFQNCHTGKCFPSYEAIMEKAGCCRRTVAAAIKALEAAGLLSWVHRIKRVCGRVLRTSNGYWFNPPPDVERSECKLPSRTAGQAYLLSLATPVPTPTEVDPDLAAALGRLERGLAMERRG